MPDQVTLRFILDKKNDLGVSFRHAPIHAL
jgi:hypothetical protein